MMVEYARLVRKWGKGVPICVDSSNDDVLIAGLKEWYNTDEAGQAAAAQLDQDSYRRHDDAAQEGI